MNMMKKHMLGIWLGLVLGFASCGGNPSSEEGIIQITGRIQNAPSGNIVLSQFTDSRPKVLDTLELSEGGEFSYELALTTPTFYDLNLFGQKSVRLALLDEDVQVAYDFSDPESLQIEGSVDSKEMQKLDKLFQDYQLEVNTLNEAYYEAMSSNNSEEIKKIQLEAMALESRQATKVKEMITSMGDSFASLAAIGLLSPKNDFPFIDDLVNKLNENYPGTIAVLQLKQQLDELRPLAVGQIAPEIELPNPDGELVKLSDLRGKYILIDFWAAWCKPCREENPNLVRLYAQYKDKGFDILGVSLDRSKEDWLKAIDDDGLSWTQISDLQYFNSVAAETYKIDAIPASYLLDPDGKIIAKGLRGLSLENKLIEIFD
ncbi:TlpA disulfide reductase family protein [Algoriphagus sp. CAU 1675]|uniref:TlpA disulfide reductase family protein n=1 Tax=Algoriphagus sp. CAU 1675 TaxID=3032597 RepID=UPI0023DB1D69|nr:TlpA disulfide reductase family protein [Algoriphagus sp. CAU 1675]MDF2158038.1 TlpA disulfide reductase family protein [Algoriphagus sp. CAU 1675]